MAENNEPRLFDNQGVDITPTPAKIALHDAASIRREMCQIYRDARCGRIEATEATKLTYILEAIRKAYETEQLERNLELLRLATKPVKERKK